MWNFYAAVAQIHDRNVIFLTVTFFKTYLVSNEIFLFHRKMITETYLIVRLSIPDETVVPFVVSI